MQKLSTIALLLAVMHNQVSGQNTPDRNRPWQADPVQAQKIMDSVPDKSRFIHKKTAGSTIPLMPGWPVKIGLWPQYPAAVDLDGNGKKEIIVADKSGYLHVFNVDGSYFNDAWPKRVGGQFLSSPIVSDLDNDGAYEIIVVEQTDFTWYFPLGRVYAYHADGSAVSGWPVLLEGAHDWMNSISSGDINNDSFKEIITADGANFASGGVTTYYKKLYAYKGDGSLLPGWPSEPDTSSPYNRRPRSPLVLVDLDNDSYLEILSGYKSWDNPSNRENAIYALRYDGSVQPGYFPVENDLMNYAVAAADMNGDGWYEIFTHGRRLKANGFNDIDWKFQEGVISHLAFADVDHDGLPEMIYGTAGKGQVFVVDNNGDPLPGWPVRTRGEDGDIVDGVPLAGDIDGDGDIEIVIGSYHTNLIFAWHHDGTVVDGFPIVSGNLDNYRMAMSDLDGDGDIEIISANSDSCIYVWDIPSTGPCTNLEWPMYQHDERHTGVYPSTHTNAVTHDADLIPAAITLGQNYPNPFNAETVIPYMLSGRAEVTLTVVDLRGRTVDVLERGIKAAGRHEAVWNAAGMTSGVYIVRLAAGSEVRVGKVLLVR